MVRSSGILMAGSFGLVSVGILFAASAAQSESPSAPAPEKLPTFMLLLHDSKPIPNQSAEARDAEIGEYAAWARALAQEGKLQDGAKLGDEAGQVLRPGEGAATVEPAKGKPGLEGYFVIVAKDYDSAVGIAKTCPHLKYGGWIEVRRIEL